MMHSTQILILIFTLGTLAVAGGDEGNTPTEHREALLAAQFVFTGKMQVTNYRFMDERNQIVPDPKKALWRHYLTERHNRDVALPLRVRKWSTVHVVKMLHGDRELLKPFLNETWVGSTYSVCPHRSMAEDGGERIWFLTIPPTDTFEPTSLHDMSTVHLEKVKQLLKSKP